MFFTAFFTLLAAYFPLRTQGNWKSPPGEVWTHLRAMIFPFLAAAMWYILRVMSYVAGTDSTTAASLNNGLVLPFEIFCYMMFTIEVVVGIVMVIYLALRPIADTLEGRNTLES